MKQKRLKTLLRQLGSVENFFFLCILLAAGLAAATLADSQNIGSSSWLQGLLAAMVLNVLACIGLRYKSARLSVLVSHAGVLVILAGAAASSLLGLRGNLTLKEQADQIPMVVDDQGQVLHWLPFKLRLKRFEIETYGRERHQLQVSHRELGWIENKEIEPGQAVVFGEGAVEIEFRRFNPDFYIDTEGGQVLQRSTQPNNPALLVSLRASPARNLWLFQGYPGMFQEALPVSVHYEYTPAAIKQYYSDLEILGAGSAVIAKKRIGVNDPMQYQGYTFYQSSYDPQDPTISIVSVVRDPGVRMVYAGFILLMIGLTFSHFRGRHERT